MEEFTGDDFWWNVGVLLNIQVKIPYLKIRDLTLIETNDPFVSTQLYICTR